MSPTKKFSGRHTVDTLNEELGMTAHHWQAAALAWGVWFLAGWSYSLAPYLLDAVGKSHTDWINHSSPDQRMNDGQKSLAMLCAGVVAMFGNPVFGYLADSQGRIVTVLLGTFLVSVATIGFAFSYSWTALVAFGCLAPFGRDGTSPVAQSLVAEWAPVRQRGWLVVLGHASFNVGRLALTGLWLVKPPNEDWVGFFLSAATLPWIALAWIFIFGWKYESPRWLSVVGERKRCAANLQLAAQSSGHMLPEEWDAPENFAIESSAVTPSNPAAGYTLSNPWIGSGMAGMKKDIALLGICYLCIGYASGGSFLYTMDYLKAALPTDSADNLSWTRWTIRSAQAAAPTAKIAGSLLLITSFKGMTLFDNCGRLFMMKVGFIGFGVFMLSLCFAGSNAFLTVCCISMAMMFEEFVWVSQSMYMTELFPTSVRNSAVGVVLVCANLGQLIAASTSLGLMRYWQHLPILAMVALLFLGGSVCFLLPADRRDKPLEDTCQNDVRSVDYNSFDESSY